MKVLASYDVSLLDDGGKRRLRRVAKVCTHYGLRVQNSVFECEVDWARYVEMRHALLQEVDLRHDSLRLYNLGNRGSEKVEHFGVKSIPELGHDTLIV